MCDTLEACLNLSSQVEAQQEEKWVTLYWGGSTLLKLMWSLPLCLSSPLDSGTALSIIKWHTAVEDVIDDPRTHLLQLWWCENRFLTSLFSCPHYRFYGGLIKTVSAAPSDSNATPLVCGITPASLSLSSVWKQMFLLNEILIMTLCWYSFSCHGNRKLTMPTEVQRFRNRTITKKNAPNLYLLDIFCRGSPRLMT